MDEKETLQSIAVCFQKKYNGFVEMESITKQLQDALNYDDVVTIRMLVRMRQQEIDNIDMTDRQWAEIADKLSKAQQDALKRAMAACLRRRTRRWCAGLARLCKTATGFWGG